MNLENVSEVMAAAMKLHEVFSYVQNQAWGSLPARERRLLESLTPRQIKTMITVGMRGGQALTLNELSAILGVGKAAASILVSALAEKKLISRTTDPENRRFVRIKYSAKGEKLSSAIFSCASRRAAEFFGVMTGSERKAFCTVAEKIHNLYSRELRIGQ